MQGVVILLVGAAFALWVGGIVTHFLFIQALKRHGLPVPDAEDFSWVRAAYPPEVHNIRWWHFACAILFLACLVTALR